MDGAVLAMVGGLLVLSMASGMLGLGVAFGFARGGLIDWRRALGPAAVTTAFAPPRSVTGARDRPGAIWAVYSALRHRLNRKEGKKGQP